MQKLSSHGRGLVLIGIYALLATISLPAVVSAQNDGRFTGAVLDPSDKFVPGATVVVKNERTGEERKVVTNAEGRYLVTGLRPSVYTLTASFGGFAPLEITGMQLVAGQEVVLDLTMQAAGVSESVTVQAYATAVDMTSARIGVNVSEREIANLPVNGRQMSQLMLQAPGSLNSGSGTWNDVRFSGRANNQNVIKYDGVEGSAIIDASPGNLNGQIPSPFKLQASLENVQEFRVESNNYPAEFGTGTGGQVSVVTKSGANMFRGSIFEYYRDDALDAPNYFDSTRNPDGSVISTLPKSKLNQHQFGGSFGGPIIRDKAFFFASYEGYRLDAGLNFVEAAPSAAAWARAVPAIQPLRPGFTSPNAVLLAGASNNADFDIYQLQGLDQVEENSFSVRLDYRINPTWNSYFRLFHDDGEDVTPQGVSGRSIRITNKPTNWVFNVQGTMGSGMVNEVKVGYNSAATRINAFAPTIGGVDWSNFVINLSGQIASTGIAGQTGSSGVVAPGGLVRASSATNGRAQPYDPYSLAFSDTLSTARGNHLIKAGAEVRMIRMTTDQLGGTTYSYANVNNFLANTPSSVQYLGDISSPSVFNEGATGNRHTAQEYYVAFAQDEWRLSPNLTFNYGLRYEYYTPLEERDNLIVKFNLDTGTIDPNTTQLHGTKKDNFQPRVSLTYSLGRTVLRGGFGMFVGPGQTEDLIQPIESDRVSSTVNSGPLNAYPVDPNALVANFENNPNNRSYAPRAYASEYAIPEKVYQYTASVQQDMGGGFTATAAYVGSQGRDLFLRSVANNITQVITNANPANAALVVREYSIPIRDANGVITSVQNPYAEIDYKTTGGKDHYNAMMLSLNRRSRNGLATNLQYTLARSRGTSGGSNEANTSGNNARTPEQFEYDNGYNNFDVRHTFNLSVIYSLPYGRGRQYGTNMSPMMDALLGSWDIGGILNARSGIPVPVTITRPDFVYRETATGLIFANPAVGREAIINVPRGGVTRSTRRPDLVPGVDPYIKDGGLVFLNPAAFATPAPGTFGNLERNSIHGPSFRQTDFFFSKHFRFGGDRDIEFRGEVFNLFNTNNFAIPPAVLPQAIPNASMTTEANRLQPGDPYTTAAAQTFGIMNSTVTKSVGLGTNRQVQFALRFNF